MTPLEKLGLEVAAFRLLGSREKAASLCALLHAQGRILTYETLANVRANDTFLTTSARPEQVVKTRICFVRESLDDVGLEDVVKTHASVGYSLPEPGRTAVIDRLIEVAG